ncbi:MAG: hypothetical protein ACOX8W_09200 [bacterium]
MADCISRKRVVELQFYSFGMHDLSDINREVAFMAVLLPIPYLAGVDGGA